jgi:hypothetical protein
MSPRVAMPRHRWNGGIEIAGLGQRFALRVGWVGQRQVQVRGRRAAIRRRIELIGRRWPQRSVPELRARI